MILSNDRCEHIGKTVESITADNIGNDLVMCDVIVITFRDRSRIVLRTDWRGSECYISEYTE